MQYILHTQKYQGTKVTFNSTKQRGKIITGTLSKILQDLQVAIINDSDNFPHCVALDTLTKC